MVFKSPPWVPDLPIAIPDSTTVGDFVLTAPGSKRSAQNEDEILVDALMGKAYSIQDLREKVDLLARTLRKELGWEPCKGNAWDKVVGIFSFNTIDYLIISWAVHRLNGIALTIHGGSAKTEIQRHFQRSKCKAVFTCASLLNTCKEVTESCAIPEDKIFLLNIPDETIDVTAQNTTTFDQLVEAGSHLPPLEPLKWQPGQGTRQIAYLAPTSGTAGTQKLAKITHFNIISNILQATTHESYAKQGKTEVGLMVLPLSHTYALEVCQLMIWRGDSIILHPKFEMMKVLESITRFQIERLYLVPAIISAIVKAPFLLDMFDCSSVHTIVSGAAPFDKNLADLVSALRPEWTILVGYGLTESSIIATLMSAHDVYLGSSGSLLPLVELRLIDQEGNDIEEHERPGEVLLRGPNIISGYLDDVEATLTLVDVDGWLHSGDVGMIKVSPNSQAEHLFIVDRMKDLIKVKGMQVAPAEIEAHLRSHPAVGEAAVIGVPDEQTGERALAFITRASGSAGKTGPGSREGLSEEELKQSINELLEANLSSTHWLDDRIIFVTEIPKNQSGKVLKGVLKGWALQKQK